MRKLLIIAALAFGMSATAQTVVKQDNSTGNYYAVSGTKTKVADKLTGKNFIDSKGNSYPVYDSAKSKLYYLKTAKTSGKVYRVYITTATEGGVKK